MSVIDLGEKRYDAAVEDTPRNPSTKRRIVRSLGLAVASSAMLSAAEGPPPEPIECNKQYYAAGALSAGQLVIGEMSITLPAPEPSVTAVPTELTLAQPVRYPTPC